MDPRSLSVVLVKATNQYLTNKNPEPETGCGQVSDFLFQRRCERNFARYYRDQILSRKFEDDLLFTVLHDIELGSLRKYHPYAFELLLGICEYLNLDTKPVEATVLSAYRTWGEIATYGAPLPDLLMMKISAFVKTIENRIQSNEPYKWYTNSML